MTVNVRRGFLLVLGVLLVVGGTGVGVSAGAFRQTEVPHPRQVLGFEPGEDYKLADYTQLLAYYRALAAASDRVVIEEVGTTTLGRPMILVVVSSARNIRDRERYKEINRRLARAQDLGEGEARRLAKEGKATLFIETGLHSTEVGPPMHAPVLAYRVATENTEEMRRIRDNVILVLNAVANPDGQDLVVEWYRKQLGTPFEETRPPVLYHYYVGHDNNRDWGMVNQRETRAITHALDYEWHPQLFYTSHQTAPFPARIAIAPMGDPVNPHFHPLVTRGVSLVGTYMAKRFEEEGKSGVLSRAQYIMWSPDGRRTTGYGHNVVGFFSETAHASATPAYHDPAELPEHFPMRGLAMPRSTRDKTDVFYPHPWEGGWARLADAVDYMLTASLAALDIAAVLKEDWLFNSYRVGREEIEEGKAGNPFAYVIPRQQWDASEAFELVRVMRRHNVEVHRAERQFVAGGRTYPAGSYVIFAAQAVRPLLRLLLEKQVFPDRRPSPDAAPIPPYDVAGWTFPLAMGVSLAIIDEPFEADVAVVTGPIAAAGSVTGADGFGYLLSTRQNASYLAVNRLLDAGDRISRAGRALDAAGQRYDAGTFVIHAGTGSRERVAELSRELGLDFLGVEQDPGAALTELRQPRVGLYKSWIASMDEGWIRWLLHDQYGFVLDTLHNADIRQADLSAYDVIILPAQRPAAIVDGHSPGTMPEEYVGGIGADGVAALRNYVERGGTVVALDVASDFAIEHFGLPVRNARSGVGRERFTIPGSLIRMRVNTEHPLGYGMLEEAAGYFSEVGGLESRGFDILNRNRVEVIARWAERDLLLSGFEWGAQQYLAGKPALVRVRHGQGSVVLSGFSPHFRGSTRGTYKLLFNSLYAAAAEAPGQ